MARTRSTRNTDSTRVLRSHTAKLAQSTPAFPSPNTHGTQTTIKRRKRLDPWTPKRKVNKNPKPRAPPPTHFSCRICISYLPASSFIRWVSPRRTYGKLLDVPAECIPHLARDPSRRNLPVCKTCVGAFMASRLDTHGVKSVSAGCLAPGCTTPWPWEKVMEYFPADRLEAFNLASFETWRADADLYVCPAPTCGVTALIDPFAPGYPHVECPVQSCKVRSCATCRTPWHAGQTCAEIRAAEVMSHITDSEKETLTLMQARDAKRCPNCQLVIEKDGGCPSMFCVGCRKYFNWDAAASAVPGAKKALPVASAGQAYWQGAGRVACEADGPAPARSGEVHESWYLAGCQVEIAEIASWVQMPLPDEDDADL